MKIQEFHSKVGVSKEDLFQALRKLRVIDARVVADNPTDPWTAWPEMTTSSEATALA